MAELKINEQRRELKAHGTYEFPVHAWRKRLSVYETGSFPWHWHNEIELTLVLSGKIEYRVNDSLYLLGPGEGLFCNSNALHAGGMKDGEDCDYISLTFHPRLLYGYEGSAIGSKYVESITESPALSSIPLSRERPWQQRALASVEHVYELSRERLPLYELEIQKALTEIWIELCRNFREEVERAPAQNPEKIERLRKILAYLHENYREKITLEDVAAQANLCKSECCRFFKKQMHQSIFEYLLDYRIGKSLPLLREQQSSVVEAATSVGFASPAYFTKIFRSRIGRSPREYLREEPERKEAAHGTTDLF